jgi:serine/threonine protein kinase
MDLMDGDLRFHLKIFFKTCSRGLLRNQQQTLTDENIQYFLYQLLLGVHKIHSANVLHRDLKPSNILLNAEMDLCICDFGLSRGIDAEDPTQSTLYVATRWYRAPELLLQYPKSSKAIDLWSVGCIFGELLQEGTRRPLFPGQNYLKQIDLILDRLGTPKEDEMKGSEKAVKYVKGLPLKLKKKWENKYPKVNPSALGFYFLKFIPTSLDLLEKLLTFDPDKRITAEEALKHEYLSKIYDEEDLIDLDIFEYQFDDSIDLDVDQDAVKRMIYQEIVDFNKTQNHIFGDAKMDDEEIVIIEEKK